MRGSRRRTARRQRAIAPVPTDVPNLFRLDAYIVGNRYRAVGSVVIADVVDRRLLLRLRPIEGLARRVG